MKMADHYEFLSLPYYYCKYVANGMVPTTGMVVDEVVNDATYV